MRFIFSFCAVLLTRELFEEISRGPKVYSVLLVLAIIFIICGYLYLKKAYNWLKFIGIASLISFCFDMETLNRIDIFEIIINVLPILFYIVIGLIALIILAVSILILPDWFRNKFNKPINRIKTIEDIFPNQKEDIPAENFQFMQSEYSDKSTPQVPDESTPDLVTNNPSYFTAGLY